MASADPKRRLPEAANWSVSPHGEHKVLAAARIEPTFSPQKRAEGDLIEPDRQDEEFLNRPQPATLSELPFVLLRGIAFRLMRWLMPVTHDPPSEAQGPVGISASVSGTGESTNSDSHSGMIRCDSKESVPDPDREEVPAAKAGRLPGVAFSCDFCGPHFRAFWRRSARIACRTVHSGLRKPADGDLQLCCPDCKDAEKQRIP
jgi:hypothetical protein